MPASLGALLCGEESGANPMLAFYRELYGRSLLEELVRPTFVFSTDVVGIRNARVTQLMLYVLASEWLSARFSVRHCSGYSLGYGAVFACTDALSIERFVSEPYAALLPYSADNLLAWQRGTFRSTMLYCPDNPSFAEQIEQILEHYPEVRVKDRRSRYACQLAGPAEPMALMRAEVIAREPGAARSSTQLIKSDTAHLYPERYEAVRRAFGDCGLSPPACEILLHRETPLAAQRPVTDPAATLFEALVAPLAMAPINAGIRRHDLPVVTVGSVRVSRFAFYGFGAELAPTPFYHWEDVLLDGPQARPLAMPQDTVSW